MELTGKIIHVLPEQSGESQRGPWRKQEYVIEVPGEYPKQVCFQVWGEKIDEFGIADGQELTIHIDLQSREYNGRWYTDVKAWRVQPAGQGAEAQASRTPDGFQDRDDRQGQGQGQGQDQDQGKGQDQHPAFDDDIPF